MTATRKAIMDPYTGCKMVPFGQSMTSASGKGIAFDMRCVECGRVEHVDDDGDAARSINRAFRPS